MTELRRRLGAFKHAEWEGIAERAGVAKSLPRKIMYGERESPRVNTIEPLLNYLRALDESGEEYGEPAKTA